MNIIAFFIIIIIGDLAKILLLLIMVFLLIFYWDYIYLWSKGIIFSSILSLFLGLFLFFPSFLDFADFMVLRILWSNVNSTWRYFSCMRSYQSFISYLAICYNFSSLVLSTTYSGHITSLSCGFFRFWLLI